MKEFTELIKEVCQVESYIENLTLENERSQVEVEEHIEYAKNQLHVLFEQIQELTIQLESKEKETMLLQSKLDEAKKVGNHLAAFRPNEINSFPEKLTMTDDLIQINNDLQDEVNELQQKLIKREKHLESLHQSYLTAEEIMTEENRRLKDENENLNTEVKSITLRYQRVKNDFLKNVETLRLLKSKLLIQQSFEEILSDSEKLKNENNKCYSEIENIQKKYENIKEQFNSYSETLTSMTEKQNKYCDENKKLNEEKIQLQHKLIAGCNKVTKLKEDLKQKQSVLESIEDEVKMKNEEINSLKETLVSERKKFKETVKNSEERTVAINLESNQFRQQVEDVTNQFSHYSNTYEEYLNLLNNNQKQLVCSKIQYEIDVEYLKCIIYNQKNLILNLQNQIADLTHVPVETKDAEVSATEDIETRDVETNTESDKPEIEKQIELTTRIIFENVLIRIDTYKERNQNPCDNTQLKRYKGESLFVTKMMGIIDKKITNLLSEVKEYFEGTIARIHKDYEIEAQKQLTQSETNLSKLKMNYERSLSIIRKEHADKVGKLIAEHQEEVKHMSLYQQNIHSIKEKLSRGKKRLS